MLATSSPLILTPLTYLAGRLWGFLLCTTLLSAVLCCLCEVFYKWNPSSTVFCCYDPLFVIFSWISVCLFKLEEFVDIVFLSSSWSYCYSVGLVSWTEFHSAIFTMYLSLGRDAILSASLHFILLWVLNQHRVFAFLSLKGLHLCVHSSSSIAVMSISSSTSFLIERSLSLS